MLVHTHKHAWGKERDGPPSGPSACAGVGCAGTRPEDTHTGWVRGRRVPQMWGPLSESPHPAPALLGSGKYKYTRGQGQCLWEPPLRWFEQNGPKRLVFECLLPCWWNCRGLGGAALLEEICHWSWVSRFQNTTIPVGSLSASNLQIGWKLSATTLRHGPQHDGHCLTL